MALAFLPILLVCCNLFLLEGSALVESTPRLKQLTEYYKATWRHGFYPMNLWNVVDKTICTKQRSRGMAQQAEQRARKTPPKHIPTDRIYAERTATGTAESSTSQIMFTLVFSVVID